MRERYIGLMSGTSADGIDAVLALFENGHYSGLQGVSHYDYPESLRASLLAMGRTESDSITLKEFARLDAAVADCFSEAALQLLRTVGLVPHDITAIGSHGQTVFHDPRGVHSSLQLGDPNRIAARVGTTVVADFRRADVAHGGEGAPLVPAFHHAVFAADAPRTIINIGGIANVTWLPNKAADSVRGFDCGPGNALMDEWAQKTLHRSYDEDGRQAEAGTPQISLLNLLSTDPYFAAKPPKSTGRAQFNLDWVNQRCKGFAWQKLRVVDVQSTFCELTALTIAAAVAPDTQHVLICGGGARNGHLMRRLQAHMPNVRIESTAAAGVPPEWVEAAAFAWLAQRRMHRLSGNLPAVTGAKCAASLGGVFLPGL